MTYSANLFIVSAPSGAGKTSLMNAVILDLDNVKLSISHTTRNKRENEQFNKNYFFITKDEFNKKKSAGLFLENALVFNNYYGTLAESVYSYLLKGTDVVLEIDWQGAQQVKEKHPEAISIFILPPSEEILYNRLIARNQDADQIIKNRMKKARLEISHFKEYDYIIVNNDFTTAKEEIKTIILAARLKLSIQKNRLKKLIAQYK